jgi:hypothetical protein
MAHGDRPIGSGRLENRGAIGPDGSQLIADPTLPTIASQRGHTQHLSNGIRSSASSKSRRVVSFVDSSSEEKEDRSGAWDVSSPFVSIAGLTDPEAWVDRHGDGLYRYARLRLRSPDLAADVVQETFLEALRARHSFAGRSSERAWLVGILRPIRYVGLRRLGAATPLFRARLSGQDRRNSRPGFAESRSTGRRPAR